MIARNTTKKFATDLKVGDEVIASDGVLVVSRVEVFAAFTIVDFADGTATPPLARGVWMEVQKTD